MAQKPGRGRKTVVRSTLRRRLWQLLAITLVFMLGFMAWLDATVRSRFESHQWVVPARVYARPMELYTGMPLSGSQLLQMLNLLGYQQRSTADRPGSFTNQDNRWLLHTRGFSDSDGGESRRQLALTIEQQRVTALLSGGQPVAVARLEPLELGSIHPGQAEDRILVALPAVPSTLVQMLLAVEDRDFYQHRGLSYRGLARAMIANIRSGRVTQGGSTLTQQLVKNVWLTRDRTLRRKLLEMPMALLLEVHYSKDRILETYLNEVYLGQDGNRAIHGFGLAARFWFGRPLEDLDVHQQALLVALLRGPSWYDPRRNPQRAMARRNRVLEVAHEAGVLKAEQLSHYQEQSLDVIKRGTGTLYAFPAFIDLVRRQLARDYPREVLAREGLRIHSTLDVRLQLMAEQILGQSLEQQDPGGVRQLEGSLVVTDAQQGDVLAIVGGRQTRQTGFNRALDAIRPIGSLIKPAIIMAALEQPEHYSLATVVDDSPMQLLMPGNRQWVPRNFDDRSLGPIPLVDALTLSRNQAMVRLGMDVGLDRVIDALERLGVQRSMPAYPSLLLGSLEMSPFEVGVFYQTLANGGYRSPLRAITEVMDQQGQPLGRYPFRLQQQVDPDVAWLLQWTLQQVMLSGTGRHAPMQGRAGVAGKTGTTDGNRDAWFAGFSGSHLAIAWVGRDDNQQANVSGAASALPIWAELMDQISTQPLSMVPPPGVSMQWIDEAGLRLSADGCPGARRYPLLVEHVPEVQSPCAGGQQRTEGDRWWNRWFGQ